MNNNLFTQLTGKTAIHKATKKPVIIIGVGWFRNQMDFDVLVPVTDEKEKVRLCKATYSQEELEING